MNHINYFLPYAKGTEKHEDHLTRAFLVLLKHSPNILQHFYSYVYHQTYNSEQSTIKTLYESSFTNIDFQTQVGSLPVADVYVSILITNEKLDIHQEIIPAERSAIYDGVLNFNNELVFFIENKLNKDSVYGLQLCPAKKDIPDESTLIGKVVVLEWKEIINNLHRINSSNISNYHDKILVTDFFELVNLRFDYLNPYNDFSKCHTAYLATKRIEQILKDITFVEDKVKYHINWGYYLELDFDEIKKIALLLNEDNNGKWMGLTITADFGSTVSQARALYSRISSETFVDELKSFKISSDLHLAIRSQNIIFFKSPDNSLKKYIDYWKSGIADKFGGVLKTELEQEYLFEYTKNGLIIYDRDKQNEVKNTILNKGYLRVNICPAILVELFISKEEAMELDKNNLLSSFIKERMMDILGVLKYPISNILKN